MSKKSIVNQLSLCRFVSVKQSSLLSFWSPNNTHDVKLRHYARCSKKCERWGTRLSSRI